MDLLTSRGHWESTRPWVALAATLTLAALGSACSGGSVKGAQPQGPAGIPVKVETAQLVPVRETTEYVATLKSRDTAVIMPQVEGQITAIFVHSGSRVSAGTPLMQIDPAKQQATLKTQEDTLAAKQAEVKWDRAGVRAQQRTIRRKSHQQTGARHQSRTALDQARAQLQALQAQVRQGECATALLPRDRSQRRDRRRHSGAGRRPCNHHHTLDYR